MVQQAVRQRLAARDAALSPFAMRETTSLGRTLPEEAPSLRGEYQRDRDRIVHSKAFRRLKHKTQVFIAPAGDHFVTRLTHTLEVAQVGRTIARALNLNEDLVEAMALGHDLGHTPFGHVGEQALDHLSPGGFRHSQQSLRVVDLLEKEGEGLNLTRETRQGILNHSKPRDDLLRLESDDLTLETQVCRLADAVAYINHDIGDALRAGLIQQEDLPRQAVALLGQRHSERINTLVVDIVESSWAATGEVPLSPETRPAITMSPPVAQAVNLLREFMFQAVYIPASSGPEGVVANRLINLLYHHFLQHPQELPSALAKEDQPLEQRVVDHVASMTDQFALLLAERSWPGSTDRVFSGRLL
ncbi:MAG: deoxyguanosinetriphosphate triphosphohydrolase [Chloroflexi bacterium]|nr:deoxyguanosinetriphosphate triphosphohydrolase [Chloroflexota bacterium]